MIRPSGYLIQRTLVSSGFGLSDHVPPARGTGSDREVRPGEWPSAAARYGSEPGLVSRQAGTPVDCSPRNGHSPGHDEELPMNRHLTATLLLALAMTLAGPGSNRAEAQYDFPAAAPVVEFGPIGTVTSLGGVVFDSIPASSPVPQFSYSYFAAFPGPARQYVPYGPADSFPFYGTPYGKPYDRWTWETMSGPPSTLQRYYYPPVR